MGKGRGAKGAMGLSDLFNDTFSRTFSGAFSGTSKCIGNEGVAACAFCHTTMLLTR